MKDRSDSQRAKAAGMMPGVATSRSKLGMEMTNPAPQPSARHVSPGPADRYQRPGALMSSQRMAYANGGKVAKPVAKKDERKGMEKAEERKEVKADLKRDRGMMARFGRMDERKDKKAVVRAVHKHEAHLHKGEPRTKFKKGGRVACAAGGAAKLRRGEAKPVPKMPHGGNPTY